MSSKLSNDHEIERRWLLREPPLELIQQFPKVTIVQGYAQCLPGELIAQKRTDDGYELVLHIPIPENSLGVKLASFVPPWIYEHYQNPKNQGKIRIREIDGTEWIMTVKGDGTLSRPEWEVVVPERAARFLFERSVPRVIQKTRTKVPEGNQTLEIDVYTHRHDLIGLVLIECEFMNEEAARTFTLPKWVGPVREVTEDKRYTGSSLARHGVPFDPC